MAMENDEAVNKFKAKVSGVVEDGPPNVDDEGEGDGAETSGADEDEFVIGGDDADEPESRDAKKRQRRAILERNRILEEQVRELREKTARLEGAMSNQPNAAQVAEIARRAAAEESAEDPLMQAVSAINKKQKRLWADYSAKANAGKLTQADEEEIEAEMSRLEVEKAIAINRHTAPKPDKAENMLSLIQARAPDVLSDPRKAAWLRARYAQFMVEGFEDNWETLDVVLGETRAKFGGRGEVSHVDTRRKERYSGVPVGRGGDDGQKTYKMTKLDKDFADAAYGHIEDPRKRYQMWANKVGKRLLADRHDR